MKPTRYLRINQRQTDRTPSYYPLYVGSVFIGVYHKQQNKSIRPPYTCQQASHSFTDLPDRKKTGHLKKKRRFSALRVPQYVNDLKNSIDFAM